MRRRVTASPGPGTPPQEGLWKGGGAPASVTHNKKQKQMWRKKIGDNGLGTGGAQRDPAEI